jgi:hypothetical protein
MTKDFDAVGWMRKRRAEIDQEDEGLTWAERSRKTMEVLGDDPLWKRLAGRVVQPSGSALIRATGEM